MTKLALVVIMICLGFVAFTATKSTVPVIVALLACLPPVAILCVQSWLAWRNYRRSLTKRAVGKIVLPVICQDKATRVAWLEDSVKQLTFDLRRRPADRQVSIYLDQLKLAIGHPSDDQIRALHELRLRIISSDSFDRGNGS